MLLGATLHTIGFLMPKTDPGDIAVENVMRAFHYSMAGMNPSKFDVFMALVLMMTVTFTGLGFLNLIMANAADVSSQTLRRIIVTNVLWGAASIALTAWYQVPPPLICGILTEIPLVAALLVKK